jgi:hypothetical protein
MFGSMTNPCPCAIESCFNTAQVHLRRFRRREGGDLPFRATTLLCWDGNALLQGEIGEHHCGRCGESATQKTQRPISGRSGRAGDPFSWFQFSIQKNESDPRRASRSFRGALQGSGFLVEQVQNLLLCCVGLRQSRNTRLLQDRVLGQVRDHRRDISSGDLVLC